MQLNSKKVIYTLCFTIGFISCWFVFNIHALSGLYENILKIATHRGIIYFILFSFVAIVYNFLREGLLKFLTLQTHIKIINFAYFVNTLLTILIVYCLCEKFVYDWKFFTIHTLNYLLYVFAWYSLIKAMKVWYKYGDFFQLLLSGKIMVYLIRIICILTICNVIGFSQKLISPISAVGMLLISMSVLFICGLIFTIILKYSKKKKKIFQQWNAITQERINNNEQPKEVSIAYDQISAVGLTAVVGKRMFDISKDVDFQFIVSKLFKMCCYLISLSTTCKYSGQIQKLKKSLTFFICIIIALLCLSYTPAFHDFLLQNPKVSKVANFIMDYLFLPLGIVKVLVQIFTIIFAKKATGISTTYFTIGAFFTLITSCNLISKGNFYDTTITMSLFKGCLYASVVVIAFVIGKIYPSKQ